jgi:hypothetical protein
MGDSGDFTPVGDAICNRPLTGQKHSFRGRSEAGPIIETMPSFRLRTIASLSLCLVLGLAQAQDNEPYDADPPDRAARLSFIEGDVSLQPSGEQDWAPALLNRPLTTGDHLWTEQGARAEIQVGRAAVRLDGDTGFSFLNLDDDTIQMRMTAGVIYVRVRALDDNDLIEIATPNVALSLLRPGNYRVEVSEAGDTTLVKVSEGEAEATGGGESVVVRDQQVATFRGTGQLAAQFDRLGALDEFDSWNLDRDRRDFLATPSQTVQYVSPDVTGYQDLDEHGTWNSVPEYGYVWTPSYVAADWSPYRYGRWAWVRPWGWTWIDDAPWGYAPFHYGRWAHVRDRWCWVPGPRHVRPVYAPALVGWVGTPRVSYSGSFAGVAWFPLGPREVYVPGRRFSPRYVERVNLSNSTIISRTVVREVQENRARNVNYRNRVVPGAVTAVSRATFTSAERIGTNRVRLNEQEIERAQATSIAPQIAPVRESRLGAVRATVRPPPQSVVNRQVVVRRNPPPAAAPLVRSTTSPVNAPRATAERPSRTQDQGPRSRDIVSESVHRNRPEPAPRAERPVTETAPRARPVAPERRPAAEQVRREVEIQQRRVQQAEQAHQQRDQQRQQHQQRENSQRQQEPARQAAPRPAEQRERNVERPRVEPRQQQTRASQPVQKPAESSPPKQRDDQPRPQRN